MRAIEFRGKQKYGDGWVIGFLTFNEYRKNSYVIKTLPEEYDGFQIVSEIEVIPETVGQFTGLLDKNSIKIYEGDIVESPNPVFSDYGSTTDGKQYFYNRQQVEWSNGHFNVDSVCIDLWKLKVVGNIHDNCVQTD